MLVKVLQMCQVKYNAILHDDRLLFKTATYDDDDMTAKVIFYNLKFHQQINTFSKIIT